MTSGKKSVTVRNLLKEVGEPLQLKLVSGARSAARRVVVPDVNRPGLALGGFLKHFRAERIQIIGRGEHGYLLASRGRRVQASLSRMLAHSEVPCVIVTGADTCPRSGIR